MCLLPSCLRCLLWIININGKTGSYDDCTGLINLSFWYKVRSGGQGIFFKWQFSLNNFFHRRPIKRFKIFFNFHICTIRNFHPTMDQWDYKLLPGTETLLSPLSQSIASVPSHVMIIYKCNKVNLFISFIYFTINAETYSLYDAFSVMILSLSLCSDIKTIFYTSRVSVVGKKLSLSWFYLIYICQSNFFPNFCHLRLKVSSLWSFDVHIKALVIDGF